MRAYVYPADMGGCGYYRLIWPAMVLKAQGHDVRIVGPQHAKRITGIPDGNGKLVSASAPTDADVMVFQRVASKQMVDAFQIFRHNGIAVVVDIDDDMSAIAQSNPAWAALHPTSGGRTADYDWNTARKICETASFVTVSTDALLGRYAPHGRGMVIRNAIPTAARGIQPQPEEGVVGWPASLHSHPDDPQVVGTAMTRIQREGWKFKVIGYPNGIRDAFKLDREPISTGMMGVAEWPHAISKLQVGIAPLNDTRFNAAKSWLKMLECAAVRVPVVGSPRSEYRRIHQLGVGLLADNPGQWYSHVKRLLKDDSFRDEVIQRGYEATIDLTIEGNAWRWAEAWAKALEVERGALNVRNGSR